jgi:hypothetical protein
MTNKYDDVRVTEEIDDDGRRFVLSLDGKRIVANSMKECLKAMGSSTIYRRLSGGERSM